MLKRIRRREIELTRRRRGGIKRGESKLASNQFTMCALHSLGPSERLMHLPREEKEEAERGDQDKKRGNQKERDRSSQ